MDRDELIERIEETLEDQDNPFITTEQKELLERILQELKDVG